MGSKNQQTELFFTTEVDPRRICGIDEAGRGPLAGPVCAAAVILPAGFPIGLLNDSKKLTHHQRQIAEKVIKEKAQWAIGWATNQEIDELNILRATFLAMRITATKMDGREIPLLIDGKFVL